MTRSFRFAALAALAALGFAAPSADAAFSYTTQVQSISYGGTTTTLTNSGNPSRATTTVSGVTITFTNDSGTNLNTTLQTASIGVALSGSYTASTAQTGPITVVSLINFTSNGQSVTFTETSTYTLYNTAMGGTIPSSTYTLVSSGSMINPTTGTAGGSTFGVLTANSTSADNNNGSTITGTFTIVNAVPEPASVAMLGLGLVGTLGFAARRRLAA